jgi:hypothetical protein
LFVIIKLDLPPNFLQKAPSNRRNDVVQDEEHETNNKDQINDFVEVDNNNNIVQDDGTNQIIQGLFGHPNEDHGDVVIVFMINL